MNVVDLAEQRRKRLWNTMLEMGMGVPIHGMPTDHLLILNRSRAVKAANHLRVAINHPKKRPDRFKKANTLLQAMKLDLVMNDATKTKLIKRKAQLMRFAARTTLYLHAKMVAEKWNRFPTERFQEMLRNRRQYEDTARPTVPQLPPLTMEEYLAIKWASGFRNQPECEEDGMGGGEPQLDWRLQAMLDRTVSCDQIRVDVPISVRQPAAIDRNYLRAAMTA